MKEQGGNFPPVGSERFRNPKQPTPDRFRQTPEEEKEPRDWRHRAACRDEDPELFYPTGTSGPALLQIAEAKAVCRRCPVLEECRKWALDNGIDTGVWGGMSEKERRALKRHNARTGQRGRSSETS